MGVDLGIKLEKQCCIELTVTNWIWGRDKTEGDIEEEVDNTVYWLVCYYGLMPPPQPANSYVGILMLNVMVLGGGASGR